MEYWRLLAHNHWYSIDLFGHEIRLCARCSGYVLGFISTFLISKLLGLNPLKYLDIRFQILVSFLLLIPLATDWVTQSWGYRESNNKIRLITGLLMGLNIYLFYTIDSTKINKGLVLLYIALGLTSLGIIGKRYTQKKRKNL